MDTINGFLAVAYQHPFLLIALLAIPISTITALLAGEIERKTIALLLSRPISRIGIVVSAAATSALWSALAITASTAGTVIAANLAGQAEKLNMAAIQSIGANLFALGLAVAGICLFFSACTNERSDATGWTVTVILFMYVWNFLSQMWPVARPYGGISVFHFFSPAQVMLGTANLSVNHAVLGVVACVGLIMGCLVYSTREFRI
ncbi:MAG: ABC transporter permease [Candidatus Sumerlaeaceae bacterium]|nr:ABC transporter permease [Candidatus Sumerlaeaceae bacterium]